MSNQHTFPGGKALERRRIQAADRQAFRDSRTNEQQIARLLARPGKSVSEIARLS